MKYEEVVGGFHKRVLEMRAIDAFLETERFDEAFDRAKANERERLLVILKSESIERVRAWTTEQLAGPLKFRSFRQLRELAKKNNVYRWSRLSRDELLEALYERGLE